MGDHIDNVIKKLDLGKSISVQEKVDAVMRYLIEKRWITTNIYNKDLAFSPGTLPNVKEFLFYAITNPDFVYEKEDKILALAARARAVEQNVAGLSSSEDHEKLKDELEGLLERCPNSSKEIVQAVDTISGRPHEWRIYTPNAYQQKKLVQAASGIIYFFGNAPFICSGNDIIDLTFLPQGFVHGFVSLAILAHDLLERLNVRSEVIMMDGIEDYMIGSGQYPDQIRAVLRYQLEDGTVKKCDPLCHFHPNFVNAGWLKERFIDDPGYFVDVVAIRKYKTARNIKGGPLA